MTQNNLGIAYRNMSEIQEKAANLKRAIDAYKIALDYFEPEVAPLDFAMMQQNLGAAYWALSEVENMKDNLKQAIAAFEAALVYRTLV